MIFQNENKSNLILVNNLPCKKVKKHNCVQHILKKICLTDRHTDYRTKKCGKHNTYLQAEALNHNKTKTIKITQKLFKDIVDL